MKLLMISGDRSILQGKRGAFWYTLQELRKHFDRIDVITPYAGRRKKSGGSVAHSDATPSGGGSVHLHPAPLGLWFQPFWIYRKGKKLWKEHQHEVMTVHEFPPFYNGIGAVRLHRATGIPYALEIHHVVGMPEASSLTERIGRWMSKKYLAKDSANAKKVRVVNTEVKELLSTLGIPKEKISIVPSFYLDSALLRSELQPPKAYDVAFCGRLVANKGLKELIEGIALTPNLRLLVIGDGPERKAREQQVRAAKLDDRVTFVGWLPTQEAVIGAIQTARTFVMNSKSEGGPRSALEAMASGMPVIATCVGVMPEVIQDGVNGLFTTGQPKDLAMKIQILVDDEQRRNDLGKEARKILDRFERSTLVKAYADFLKSLV